MFDNFCITEFTSHEAELYLKTLVAIAWSDACFHEDEKEYVSMQAKRLSMDINDVTWSHEEGFAFLNEAQISYEVRKVFLRDCIILCSLDGDYSRIERMAVLDVARLLGFDEVDVEEIEAWRTSLMP